MNRPDYAGDERKLQAFAARMWAALDAHECGEFDHAELYRRRKAIWVEVPRHLLRDLTRLLTAQLAVRDSKPEAKEVPQ